MSRASVAKTRPAASGASIRLLSMPFVPALATLLALLPAPAPAEPELGEGFSGSARLGYLATSGNTDSENGSLRLRLDYESGPWAHRITAAGIAAREEETTTAESYELGGRTHYDINEHDFIFGRLNWRKDRFSGVDNQFRQTVGYGRRLIGTDRQQLEVELGAGARQAELSDGRSQNEAILRAGSDYRLAVNEHTSVTANLGVESGLDNTFSEFELALRSQLLGQLAFVGSYTIRYNSDVPPENTSIDRYTQISLEYSF